MAPTSISTGSSAQRAGASRRDRRLVIAVCAALVVAVLLVFSQTLRQGFLNFDDWIFVSDEPHVSGGFSWSGIAWAFVKGGPRGDWCPLTMLSHMLDCQLYGLKPAGHHLSNVLLHAASAAGLFLVLRRMTGRLWPSALVAALFAVHPLRVESVAWIAERRDLLSGLFFVLTLGAYEEYSRHPRSLGRYLAVIGLLALGLMSKTMLMTLPAVLLLLDFWPLERFRGSRQNGDGPIVRPTQSAWRLVVEKLPLAALSLVSAMAALQSHGVSNSNPILTLPERLANAPVSCVAYLGQFFVPARLSFFYPYPATGMPPAWQVAAASALLFSLTAAAVIWRRTYPYFFVGWFWFVGMLVPVLELITVGGHARADRYTYLPQIGLDVALVWGAMGLGASWPSRRRVFGVGSALVLAALVAATWRQTGFWRDSKTLWEHALACDEKNVTAHFNLAAVLHDEARDEAGAIAHYRQATELDSSGRDLYYGPRMRAYYGLGLIAARNGDLDEAVAEYQRALEVAPDFVLALVNLGFVLAEQGKLADAKVCFERARQFSPEGVDPDCGLGVVLARQGKTDEAIASFRRALALDPDSLLAHRNLANLLAGRDDAEAIAHLRRAIELDPDSAGDYHQLAGLLRQQGKTREADRYEALGKQAALRQAETLTERGSQLAGQSKFDDAVAQFQSAIAAAPDYAPAHCRLADALAAKGYLEQAAAEYRQALAIDPGLQPAREGLRRLEH